MSERAAEIMLALSPEERIAFALVWDDTVGDLTIGQIKAIAKTAAEAVIDPADAWRAGWLAMGQEHIKQRNDPSHPIGEGVVNPYEADR